MRDTILTLASHPLLPSQEQFAMSHNQDGRLTDVPTDHPAVDQSTVFASPDAHESSDRLSQMLTASPIVLYCVAPGGQHPVTFMSESVRSILGYEPDAFLGDTGLWAHSIHPDDAPHVFAALDELLTVGAHAIDYRFRHADGSYRWVHDTARLLPAAAGAAPAIIGSWQDVTEQRARQDALVAQETALRASEERLRLTLDATDDGVWDWDLTTNALYVSPRWLGMLGYLPGDLPPDVSAWQRIVHPDDMSHVMPLVEGALDGTVPGYRAEFRALQRDGSWRWVLARGKVVSRADNGQPLRMLGTHTDIAERRQIDEQLRRFAALVENSTSGLVLAGLDGTLQYLNPAFCAMLGIATVEPRLPLTAVLPAHELPRAPQIIGAIVDQGVWQGSVDFERADGSSFPGWLSAFRVRDAAGAPIALAGIVQDLTAQQRAEYERAALQEQVIAAQQAALRELSTPLIPIAEGVVALPLIGSIDSGRARLVIETLLSGVSGMRASTAIIDITGVPVVDTQVADVLVRAAQSVKLLGADVILTGIRPEVAQTLVGLGVDLRGIRTLGTLQQGIADALRITQKGWYP